MLISRGHLLLRVEIQMVKFLQPQRYTVELGQKV